MIAASPMFTRRRLLRGSAVLALSLPLAGLRMPRSLADALPPVAVWSDPNCGCCEGWTKHMRTAGFAVTVRLSDNMTDIIDGYVIEGHVPAADIRRLLEERPEARGLAIPGMPASAPGMDQPGIPYTVMLFGGAGGEQVFARHEG